MEFIVELDKMKTILRQTSIIGDERREDDAQHSWHISVMALLLAEYSNETIDVNKTIKMLLIHDLVEIQAGDTFCFDKEANIGKREREEKAIEAISKNLSGNKGEEIKSLWTEFEDMETHEAIFAASMDRLQPMLNNYNNNGGTWRKFNVSKKDILKRIEPLKHSSDELWKFAEAMIEDAHRKGLITNPEK
nr:HD domain-containing protein [Tissierella sp.]